MIRKVLLATVAICAVAGTAFAADLPSRRAPPVYAPPPPIPVFTWTGFYIGAQAGYGFGRSSANVLATGTGESFGSGSRDENGFIGGGHVGYLFSTQSIPVLGQLTGAFSSVPVLGGFGGAGGVFGIEGDVDGSTQKISYGYNGLASAYSSRPIQGSIRGRLGFAVDRVLFYATGGAAFGDLRNDYSILGFTDHYSRSRVGYTVGGGIEYAVTNNVSVRAEYRYTDFGSYQDVLNNTTGGAFTVRRRDTDQRVQGGISYKFDTFAPAAPVVARY